MSKSLWYSSVEDVLAIHDDIVSEYPNTPSGVKNRVRAERHRRGKFRLGTGDDSREVMSYHLLRLLVANHPFVDANKRTALNTVVVFYFLNGYRFKYD